MRNPRAGLLKGNGKNSTCPVSLGRRGSPSTGVHPLILGRHNLPVWTVSKAPQKPVSKVCCSRGGPEKPRTSCWGPTRLLGTNLPRTEGMAPQTCSPRGYPATCSRSAHPGVLPLLKSCFTE